MAVVGDIQPPGSVSTWETGGPWEEELPLQVPREMGVHLARNSKTEGLVTASTPRILGGWETPTQDPPAPGPQHSGPQELQYALGPKRKALAPTPCIPPAPIGPAPIPTSCSQPSPSPLLLGIQMVSTMAPPPPVWGTGQGQDPTTPITLLAPKPPCFSCRNVCPPPPLCLSSRPPRSSLSPVHPAAFTRLQLTFLGLSPLLPPICSSQGCPWASDGPLRLSLCSLCTCLCPVTSNSFSGADHLFPGCLAAMLMLWCGQNN